MVCVGFVAMQKLKKSSSVLMKVKIEIIISSLFLTLCLQNRQGNSVGSLFWKISDDRCLHVQHWIIATILILILSNCVAFTYRDDIVSFLAGFGLAGFLALFRPIFVY